MKDKITAMNETNYQVRQRVTALQEILSKVKKLKVDGELMKKDHDQVKTICDQTRDCTIWVVVYESGSCFVRARAAYKTTVGNDWFTKDYYLGNFKTGEFPEVDIPGNVTEEEHKAALQEIAKLKEQRFEIDQRISKLQSEWQL